MPSPKRSPDRAMTRSGTIDMETKPKQPGSPGASHRGQEGSRLHLALRADLEKHSRSIEDLVVVHCRHLEEHLRVAQEQQDEVKDENLRIASDFDTKLEAFHTKQAEHHAALLERIEEMLQSMQNRQPALSFEPGDDSSTVAATPSAAAGPSPGSDSSCLVLAHGMLPAGVFDVPGQVPEEETFESPGANNSNSPGGSSPPSPRHSFQSQEGSKEELDAGEDPETSRITTSSRRTSALSRVKSILGRRTSSATDKPMLNSNLSFAEMKEAYGITRSRTRDSRMVRETLNRSGRFRKFATNIVLHPRFEPCCSLIMLLCGIQIGVEAHVGMQVAMNGTKIDFREIDLLFNSFFTAELIVRWTADGCYFWSCNNSALRWNMMDICLVSVGWMQEIFTLLASAGGVIDLGMMRLLRMLRLVRIARILRVVRFFSELRVMVNGILGSARSLLWAFILLCLVMFTIGVTIMQIAAGYVESARDDENAADTIKDLKEYYGSLLRTILSLYMAIAGGIDWRDIVVPLRDIHITLELLVSGYVFFTTFCCLNIVTGIFVDNAKALKMADEEAMYQEALAERRRWIAEVADLFSRVDSNKADSFDFETFQSKMHDIRVQTIFRKLGINTDTTSAEELWEILDTDMSGNIDQEEFANGIKHFHGDAKSIDVYRLRRDGKKMSKEIQTITDMVKGMMFQMSSAFGAPIHLTKSRRHDSTDMKDVASMRAAHRSHQSTYRPGPPAPKMEGFATDPPGNAPEMSMPSKGSMPSKEILG